MLRHFDRGESEVEPAVARFCAPSTRTIRSTPFRSWCSSTTANSRARSLNNFLWTTFTRSNPAADVHGIGNFIRDKHWGCRGSLIINARLKPHHAPPLVENPAVSKSVDQLAAPGGPLHGIL